ncbi:MAG: universal stress protein [Actinomycetota bacterium]
MTMDVHRPGHDVGDVVVPLDGSVLASTALRTGFSVAERTGGRVLLVQAVDATERTSTVAAQLEEHLDRFGEVAPADATVVHDDPAHAILAAAGEHATICMATQGRSGVRRIVLGSVAEAVVRSASRPVLLVGPTAGAPPLARERASLVICARGDGAGEWISSAAAGIAGSLDLTCWVVEVITPDEETAPGGATPSRPGYDAALARCSEHAARLERDGIVARPEVLFGDPARAIEAFAKSVHASYLAVATAARTGIDRHTLGSTAAQITRRAPCPIFVTVDPSRSSA